MRTILAAIAVLYTPTATQDEPPRRVNYPAYCMNWIGVPSGYDRLINIPGALNTAWRCDQLIHFRET